MSTEMMQKLISLLVADAVRKALIIEGESAPELKEIKYREQFIGYKISWLLGNNFCQEILIVADFDLAHLDLIAQVVCEGRAHIIEHEVYDIYLNGGPENLEELLEWIDVQTAIIFQSMSWVNNPVDLEKWLNI